MPPEQAERVMRFAHEHDLTVSEAIRALVDQALDSKKPTE